jgi:hypothetical protein
MIASNKRKNFNRNPEGYNQWELRSNVEVQIIIDQKPTWTKKDFRGEGKLNPKKETALLTRTETDRPDLKFGQIGRRKKPLKEIYKHSTAESIAAFNSKQIDEDTFRNRAKQKKIRDNMSSLERKYFYKKEYAQLTEDQLEAKRIRNIKYRERIKNA